MKKEFAKFMLNKNFRSAGELIFSATINIKAPQNVNLNINVDKEKNINDLVKQMEACYNEIKEKLSEISFDKTWKEIFTKPELSEKQNLQNNENVLSKAQSAFDNLMVQIKTRQYEQIFETITLTSNAILQGVIDAALNIANKI